MKKVFYRCDEATVRWWTVGKEYELYYGNFIVDDDAFPLAKEHSILTHRRHFTRIERETFIAHGVEWFENPENAEDNTCPLYGSSIILLFSDGQQIEHVVGDPWRKIVDDLWIGWRYNEETGNEKKPTEFQFKNDLHSIVDEIKTELFGENVGMIDRDSVAAMDDGHLTPGQKRHWDEKEKQFEQKSQEEAIRQAKEQLKKADQAKDLENAARNMNDGFNSRLGWMG